MVNKHRLLAEAGRIDNEARALEAEKVLNEDAAYQAEKRVTDIWNSLAEPQIERDFQLTQADVKHRQIVKLRKRSEKLRRKALKNG